MAFTIPNNILATNVDSIEEFIGFKLPITFETVNQSTTTLESTKANLTCLLLTEKGERVFQPNLGVNLRKHLFEQFSDETSVAIEEDIIEQVSVWLPFLQVSTINIKQDQPNHTISVDITYSFKSSPGMVDSMQMDITTRGTY